MYATHTNSQIELNLNLLDPNVLCVYKFSVLAIRKIFSKLIQVIGKGISFSGLRFVQRKLFREVIKCVCSGDYRFV